MRLVHILRSVRQLNPARTSNIFFTNNQVTLEVIRQLILVVSLDSRTHGLHPHDNVHTSPTINSPMVLDCHRAGTTFFPPSMPVTGGSTNVVPLSLRRTPSPRGPRANLHLAMPRERVRSFCSQRQIRICCQRGRLAVRPGAMSACVSDYSVSVYCPRTFSPPGLLFFLDLISLSQDGRDWTRSRVHVSRRSSVLYLAPTASETTQMIAFTGSLTMAQTGSSS